MDYLIRCVHCYVDKKPQAYRREFRLGPEPICKKCEPDVTGTFFGVGGMVVKAQKRKCLKCDRVFKSINGYRICGACKKTEVMRSSDWMDF